MANICDTQYKVMGERKAVADLWNTLQTMEVNTKNVYLYKWRNTMASTMRRWAYR